MGVHHGRVDLCGNRAQDFVPSARRESWICRARKLITSGSWVSTTGEIRAGCPAGFRAPVPRYPRNPVQTGLSHVIDFIRLRNRGNLDRDLPESWTGRPRIAGRPPRRITSTSRDRSVLSTLARTIGLPASNLPSCEPVAAQGSSNMRSWLSHSSVLARSSVRGSVASKRESDRNTNPRAPDAMAWYTMSRICSGSRLQEPSARPPITHACCTIPGCNSVRMAAQKGVPVRVNRDRCKYHCPNSLNGREPLGPGGSSSNQIRDAAVLPGLLLREADQRSATRPRANCAVVVRPLA